MALLSDLATEMAILVSAIIAIAYSGFLWWWFIKRHQEQDIDPETDESFRLMRTEFAEGLKAFLDMEYRYVAFFLVVYAMLIFLCLGYVESYSTQSPPCRFDPSRKCKSALATAVVSSVSFLLGAFTSVLSSFLVMQVAVHANVRTALAMRNGVGEGFIAAFRSGAILGFLLAANGLLLLYIAISLFKLYYGNDWEGLSEAIAGYGLGGSFMALYGRTFSGIYARVADVYYYFTPFQVHWASNNNLNPAEIAYYVGHIAGDIAGTWNDLCGSYAESYCAVLLVASISSFGINHNFTAICYPLLIYAMGILVCLVTTLFTPDLNEIKGWKEVEPKLEKQLLISTILMTVGIFIVSWIALPSALTIYNFGSQKIVKKWQLVPCVGVGLWGGLPIGFVEKVCPEDVLSYIREAMDPILGLSLVKIPICAAISVCVSYRFAGFYGIGLAAVGMLSTVATRFAINAYVPMIRHAILTAMVGDIIDYHDIRYLDDHDDADHDDADHADADHADDSTAAFGKGFAIDSAALVSVALFGAFASREAMPSVAVVTPKVFIGLIVGFLLIYLFYNTTLNSVGSPVIEMVRKANRAFCNIRQHGRRFEDPYHVESLRFLKRRIIGNVAFVMFATLMIGTLFGVETLFGILAGSLGYVVQIAIWVSTDEGRRNEKKRILAVLRKAAENLPQDSPESEELRGTVNSTLPGRPFKDVSGPTLCNLIQVMAVQMLVFAPFLTTHG